MSGRDREQQQNQQKLLTVVQAILPTLEQICGKNDEILAYISQMLQRGRTERNPLTIMRENDQLYKKKLELKSLVDQMKADLVRFEQDERYSNLKHMFPRFKIESADAAMQLCDRKLRYTKALRDAMIRLLEAPNAPASAAAAVSGSSSSSSSSSAREPVFKSVIRSNQERGSFSQIEVAPSPMCMTTATM